MKPTLIDLAIRYKSDKHNHHNYCVYYDKHFSHLRDEKAVILELGVGGYEFPDRGGSGLRMWSDYFKNGKIYGIDLFDKSGIILPERTKLFKGSQNDSDFLASVISETGQPDIIIDDASHQNRLTIESFTILFPHLKKGGIYVVEDLESSWWREHGFDGEPNYNNMNAKTSINFLRYLINDVNAKHLPADPGFLPIESIHFYTNMAAIVKK